MSPLREERIPAEVREVCAHLERAGARAWIVGGCIRDLLMGREASDWDLATTALPADVQRIFPRTVPTGIAHGTITVLWKGEAYEVTTLRGDGAYSDGRRPDTIEFVSDIERDLERRDFTVNAIAFDPLEGALVDPWGGLDDLAARLVRAVRDPTLRFGEDGLRVLRAARFCATLGFTLEARTEAAIPGSLHTFRKVSPERVHEEWRKALLKSEAPSIAFAIMRRTGILGVTCPELAALDDAAFARTLVRVDATPRDAGLRLAALFLDAGDPDRWLDAWLRAMRASNQDRRRVVDAVRHARGPTPSDLAGAPLRRWLRAVGRPAIEDVLALARADGRDVDALGDRARDALANDLPLTPGELAVDGSDVMQALGVPPGRAIGAVLEALLGRVIDDPALGARERLLAELPLVYRAVTEARVGQTPSPTAAPRTARSSGGEHE